MCGSVRERVPLSHRACPVSHRAIVPNEDEDCIDAQRK